MKLSILLPVCALLEAAKLWAATQSGQWDMILIALFVQIAYVFAFFIKSQQDRIHAEFQAKLDKYYATSNDKSN